MVRLEKKKNSKTNIWEGSITPAGITIRYGLEGRLRTISIPASSCKKEGVEERLNSLVLQQIRDGFVVIGNAPEVMKAVYTARNEEATRSIKEALDDLEPTCYSTW